MKSIAILHLVFFYIIGLAFVDKIESVPLLMPWKENSENNNKTQSFVPKDLYVFRTVIYEVGVLSDPNSDSLMNDQFNTTNSIWNNNSEMDLKNKTLKYLKSMPLPPSFWQSILDDKEDDKDSSNEQDDDEETFSPLV